MKIQIKQYLIENEILDAVRGDIQNTLTKLKSVGKFRQQQTDNELALLDQNKKEIGADNVEKIKNNEQHIQNFEESLSLASIRQSYINGETMRTGTPKEAFGKQSDLSKTGITNKEEGQRTVENNQAKHAAGITEASDLRSMSEIQKNTPTPRNPTGADVMARNTGRLKSDGKNKTRVDLPGQKLNRTLAGLSNANGRAPLTKVK